MTEALTRWRLEARGLVQLVGYRERVREQAEQRGLVGSVVNDENDPHRVEIVVQGPPKTLEEFRKAISGSEGRSRPKEVMRVEELPPDPGLTDFEVWRGSLPTETLERMEQGNRVLGSMDTRLGSMDTRLGSLESLGRETLAETRKVGEKVDRLGAEVRGVGAEVQGVRTEVRGVGTEVRDGNRRLEKSLDRMHADMSARFDRVDRSYGSIGKTLLRIDKNLEKLSKALLLLAKETQRATGAARRAPSSRAPGKKGRRA